MKRKIDLWENAGYILEQVGKGVLVTTKANGVLNTMTISWGTLGIQWGKPIFTVFVRESRYTKQLMDENGEFTINIPYGAYDKTILSLCGTRSGREIDKISALELHPEQPDTISVPGLRELPLTLECKVIYKQAQEPGAITQENIDRYYPNSPEFPQGDYHTAYYGQITAAYIIE